jgi:hypothetical protein
MSRGLRFVVFVAIVELMVLSCSLSSKICVSMGSED